MKFYLYCSNRCICCISGKLEGLVMHFTKCFSSTSKSISVLLLIAVALIFWLCWKVTNNKQTRIVTPINMLFANVFSDEDALLMTAALREFTQTLEKANATYFMMAGTLLGSYRHHGKIPWDDDADLAVNYTEKEKLVELFKNSTTHTFMNVFGDKYQWKFFPKDGHSISGSEFKSPFIDVFWFEENATHIFYSCPWLPRKFPKRIVFPLRRRPFGEFMLPAPCNTTAFLTTELFEIDDCVSNDMNHMSNTYEGEVVTIPCSWMMSMHPFVRRRQQRMSNGQIFLSEFLFFNGTIINQWSHENKC